MGDILDQLRLVAGGVFCGAAFMMITLFVSGAIH
jgi:hypothetical protein